jgi:hypothetical protein
MFRVGGPVRQRVRAFLRAYARYRPVDVDRRLDALGTLTRRTNPALYARADLTAYEHKVFSQNGEDGVLVEIFNRIGVTNRFFVEFGIQNGTEGNAVLLADVFGWSGLFLEADPSDFARVRTKYLLNSRVEIGHELVTADRIEQVFASRGVPVEPDLLSIDIDGNDVYVWDALTSFRPRVVVVEYNSGIPGERPLAQPHDPGRGWDGSGAFGANLAALDVVARRRGYRLAHSDLTGTNAFFVREDCWAALAIDEAPRRAQNYGLTGITQPTKEPPGGWVDFG